MHELREYQRVQLAAGQLRPHGRHNLETKSREEEKISSSRLNNFHLKTEKCKSTSPLRKTKCYSTY